MKYFGIGFFCGFLASVTLFHASGEPDLQMTEDQKASMTLGAYIGIVAGFIPWALALYAIFTFNCRTPG